MAKKEEFTDEHERVASDLRFLVSGLQRDELDLDLFDRMENRLKNHMYDEENFIFKKIEKRYELGNEIAGFETEHAAMWRLIDLIHDEINTGHHVKIKKYFDELSDIFREHNTREERYVYSKLGEYESVTERERPRNWICNRLNRRTA